MNNKFLKCLEFFELIDIFLLEYSFYSLSIHFSSMNKNSYSNDENTTQYEKNGRNNKCEH